MKNKINLEQAIKFLESVLNSDSSDCVFKELEKIKSEKIANK
ncbi:MAG: hypothetical protein PHV37_04840 [Candidatus Gastranaerophilales bacterium]|nr:hypothetical protein [Candidatus Gastranaerophilales bacterium]